MMVIVDGPIVAWLVINKAKYETHSTRIAPQCHFKIILILLALFSVYNTIFSTSLSQISLIIMHSMKVENSSLRLWFSGASKQIDTFQTSSMAFNC